MKIIYPSEPEKLYRIDANATIPDDHYCPNLRYIWSVVDGEDVEVIQDSPQDYCYIHLAWPTKIRLQVTGCNWKLDETFLIVPKP